MLKSHCNTKLAQPLNSSAADVTLFWYQFLVHVEIEYQHLEIITCNANLFCIALKVEGSIKMRKVSKPNPPKKNLSHSF